MGEGSSSADEPGRRFGRYILLEAIDRGGMAEVYRAVSQGPGGFQRQFVIKRIRKEKAASRDFVEMFVNEARICALLEHPNIVQVYDFGQVEGDYFLAMEYLRGRNLQAVSRRLRKHRRETSQDLIAYVGREVARGLHYAHTLSNQGEPLGIVHRDVSPSNIMLLKTGGVKLLDFGIARAKMKLRALTPIGGLIKGKLSYLSPEQVRGGAIDARSDVFSLGIVMWEALTGLRLFFHPNDLDTMRNVLHRPVPKPSELRPGIAAAIDAVVIRALEREPENRYQDAAAMAADLEEHLREARFSPESVVALLGELFAGEDDARELKLPEDAGPAGRITGGTRPVVPTTSSASIPPPVVPDGESTPEGYATVSSVHRLSDIAARRRRRMLQMSALGGAGFGALAILVLTMARPNPREPGPVRVAANSLEIRGPRASAQAMPAGTKARATASAVPATIPVVREAPPVVATTPAVKPSAPRAAETTGPLAITDEHNANASPAPTRAGKAGAAVLAPAPTARADRALSSGLAALKKGEYMQAALRLEEATQAAPKSSEALLGLAEAEFELARYAQAATHARRAATLAPKNARSRSLLGDALFKLGRYREAAQVYAAASALAPSEALRERRQRAEAMMGTREEARAGSGSGD